MSTLKRRASRDASSAAGDERRAGVRAQLAPLAASAGDEPQLQRPARAAAGDASGDRQLAGRERATVRAAADDPLRLRHESPRRDHRRRSRPQAAQGESAATSCARPSPTAPSRRSPAAASASPSRRLGAAAPPTPMVLVSSRRGGMLVRNSAGQRGNAGEKLEPGQGGMVLRNWPPRGGMLVRNFAHRGECW